MQALRSETASDTPKREPEMQDTPPCQCWRWSAQTGLTIFYNVNCYFLTNTSYFILGLIESNIKERGYG